MRLAAVPEDWPVRACLCCFQETLHGKCCQGVTKEGELLIKIKQACLAWLSREVFFKNFSVNHLRPGYTNTHRNSDNSCLPARDHLILTVVCAISMAASILQAGSNTLVTLSHNLSDWALIVLVILTNGWDVMK